MEAIRLRDESVIAALTQSVFISATSVIRSLLPVAEIEHVGATAIPGAITKGDLDIMVRVSAADFPHAIAQLKTAFGIKQHENWNATFASFGEDTAYALPLGVQLVVKGSESDFFIFLRDYLLQNPGALEIYNQLKQRHAPEGSEAYRQAKNRFFSEILAMRQR
jgi:GrpB-like predicted nucleotidyltransferase (UPF0157 family)